MIGFQIRSRYLAGKFKGDTYNLTVKGFVADEDAYITECYRTPFVAAFKAFLITVEDMFDSLCAWLRHDPHASRNVLLSYVVPVKAMPGKRLRKGLHGRYV